MNNKFFPKALLIFTFLTAILILLFFYTRGFITHDEGLILSGAERIAKGQTPYRDFHLIYTPGSLFIIAMGFKTMGINILSSRITTMLFAFLTILVIYHLSTLLSKKGYTYILPIAIYVFWGPAHINFAWPVIFAIWSGLTTCLMLLYGQKKQIYSLFFISGVTTVLTLLFKQNFGLALLLSNAVFFFYEKNEKRQEHLLFHLSGITASIGLCVLYLVTTNSLIPFVKDMYFFMVDVYILNNAQRTLFIYPDIWYKMVLKTIFYLFPLIISLLATIIAFQKKKEFIFLSSFTLFFYIFGIRPTTDYVHLVTLIALIGIPFLIIYAYSENKWITQTTHVLVIILLIVAIYSSLFKNYYRWNTPLIEQNFWSSNSRVLIFTDQKTKTVISTLTNYIHKNTRTNDQIFIFDHAPTFYLVFNRENPTKFIYLPPSMISANDEKEIVGELKKKRVRVILTHEDLQYNNSIIANYIKNKYKQVIKTYEFAIWSKYSD